MAENENKNTPLLVNVLSKLLHSSELTSVEILPGGIKDWASIALPPEAPKPSPDFPFVFVEGNLGIPKKTLYSLYLAAVSIPWRSSGVNEALAASSTILLLNPAHQTALNTRKLLINDGHLDPEKELILMELMSRGSPECAKQSVVWDHRRWCLTRIYGMIGPRNTAHPIQFWASSEEMQRLPKLSPTAIQHELSLIQHTCETYPRNYHSWAYWHSVIDVCYTSIYSSDNNETQREFLGIIYAECTRLRRWVDQHVSDYSAIHQLCQSHVLLDRLRASGMLSADFDGDLTSLKLLDHAASLVHVYPSHESLWMYLRVVLPDAPPAKCTMILNELEQQPLSSPHYKRQLLKWILKSSERS